IIDYCWLRPQGPGLVRRLPLPSRAKLRRLLRSAPAPAPLPTLMQGGHWPSEPRRRGFCCCLAACGGFRKRKAATANGRGSLAHCRGLELARAEVKRVRLLFVCGGL
ncbi:unnamed protein product, partial [Effrenium voratum]